MTHRKNRLNTNDNVELEGRILLSAASNSGNSASMDNGNDEVGVNSEDVAVTGQISDDEIDGDGREQRREQRDQRRTERREERRAVREVRREERDRNRLSRRAERADQREFRRSDAEPIILGGTNDLGTPVDPVNADFTRDDGSVPLTRLSVENLGFTEDGKARVRVTQTNLSAENGVFLTPTFVAIQDGTYDLYDRGGVASPGLEMLAEDGGVDGVVSQFNASGAQGATGVISGSESGDPTPLAPGASGSVELEIDPSNARFLTFAQMVLPSNDAFIASPDDPRGIELFDAEGVFIGGEVTLTGQDVLDAGTEVNTERDAAFINQTAPNTGETEGGVIRQHAGFIGSERAGG